MARPVVLIGTGTGIGKTHAGERLLRAIGAIGRTTYGYKPLESGLPSADDPTSDAARLEAASTFHVKPLRYVLRAPISAHLAARDEGVTVDTAAILAEVQRLALLVDVLLVELPGGAFSPFDDTRLNVDMVRAMDARCALVAPDRLGVLHDVGAAARACAAAGVPVLGVILNAPAAPDASTGRNAAELPYVTRLPLLGELPLGPSDAPVTPNDPLFALAHRLLATP